MNTHIWPVELAPNPQVKVLIVFHFLGNVLCPDVLQDDGKQTWKAYKHVTQLCTNEVATWYQGIAMVTSLRMVSTLMAAMTSAPLVMEGTSMQLSNAPWIPVSSRTSSTNPVVPMMRNLCGSFCVEGGGRRGGEEEKGDGKRKGRGERRGGSKREERKGKERKSVLIPSLCGVYCMYNTNAKHRRC